MTIFRILTIPSVTRLALGSILILFALFMCSRSEAAITYVGANAPAVANNNSISFSTPAATAIGDIVLVQVAIVGGSGITINAAGGWTLVVRNNNGTALAQAVYYRFATVAGATASTWTFSSGQRMVVSAVAFRGVDSSAPINAAAGLSNGASAVITAPSITTTVDNARLVGLFSAARSDLIMSAPATFTRRTTGATGGGPNGVTAIVSDAAQTIAGATGSRTATADRSELNIGQMVALKPLAVVALPGRFEAYEPSTLPANAITGFIKTKIAGTSFLLDLAALNTAKNGLLTTFSGLVKVELLNAQDNSGTLDANNCRSTWALIGSASTVTFVTGDNGRKKNVPFTQNNAWSDVRVRMSFPATGMATAIGCSTNNFAIRPNKLLNVTISDTDWKSSGTARSLISASPSATGGIVHKAGQPFSVAASAVNSLGTTTSNYAGTPESVLVACLLPSGCDVAALPSFDIAGSWITAASPDGTISTNTATFNDAGTFSMYLEDQTFAAVDEGDTPDAERFFKSDTVNVGRFVPDNFDIVLDSSPRLLTSNNFSCAARTHTYIGQKFGYAPASAPKVIVTARSASGETTRNYRNALWKLSATSPTVTCSTSPDTCTGVAGSVTQKYTYALTPAATPGWDAAQVTLGTPTIIDNANGTGTISANATDMLAFARSLTLPQAAFTANITMALTVADASEVNGTGIPPADCSATPASCRITTDLTSEVFVGTGSGIEFDSGNLFRYGQLKLANAYGSELLNLVLPIELQYWNGTTFATNAQDTCTTIPAATISMGGYQKNLAACETAILIGGAFVGGKGNLQLTKPGPGNNGTVDLTINLGGTATGQTCVAPLPTTQITTTPGNLLYLQGKWSGTSYNQNPKSRATFGVYKRSQVIYMREVY